LVEFECANQLMVPRSLLVKTESGQGKLCKRVARKTEQKSGVNGGWRQRAEQKSHPGHLREKFKIRRVWGSIFYEFWRSELVWAGDLLSLRAFLEGVLGGGWLKLDYRRFDFWIRPEWTKFFGVWEAG